MRICRLTLVIALSPLFPVFGSEFDNSSRIGAALTDSLLFSCGANSSTADTFRCECISGANSDVTPEFQTDGLYANGGIYAVPDISGANGYGKIFWIDHGTYCDAMIEDSVDFTNNYCWISSMFGDATTTCHRFSPRLGVTRDEGANPAAWAFVVENFASSTLAGSLFWWKVPNQGADALNLTKGDTNADLGAIFDSNNGPIAAAPWRGEPVPLVALRVASPGQNTLGIVYYLNNQWNVIQTSLPNNYWIGNGISMITLPAETCPGEPNGNPVTCYRNLIFLVGGKDLATRPTLFMGTVTSFATGAPWFGGWSNLGATSSIGSDWSLGDSLSASFRPVVGGAVTTYLFDVFGKNQGAEEYIHWAQTSTGWIEDVSVPSGVGVTGSFLGHHTVVRTVVNGTTVNEVFAQQTRVGTTQAVRWHEDTSGAASFWQNRY
jgi:hypothetical protein